MTGTFRTVAVSIFIAIVVLVIVGCARISSVDLLAKRTFNVTGNVVSFYGRIDGEEYRLHAVYPYDGSPPFVVKYLRGTGSDLSPLLGTDGNYIYPMVSYTKQFTLVSYDVKQIP